MVKTGSGHWAFVFAGLTLFSVVFVGFNEVTLILGLFTGYFFGVSSPESRMNAAFATHLNKSKVFTPYGKLMPQNESDKMKRYNDNLDAIEVMKKMNPSFLQNQEEE